MILDNGVVRALAIAGDRIAGGIGTHETALASPEVVDLDGRCVLPGFTDSHVHFLEWALERTRLDLTPAASLYEALRMIAEAPAQGEWVQGHGWLSARWADGGPTAAALDTVTGDRPAALWAHDH